MDRKAGTQTDIQTGVNTQTSRCRQALAVAGMLQRDRRGSCSECHIGTALSTACFPPDVAVLTYICRWTCPAAQRLYRATKQHILQQECQSGYLWMQGRLFEHSMHNAASHCACLVSQQSLLCVAHLSEQGPGVLVAGYNLYHQPHPG